MDSIIILKKLSSQEWGVHSSKTFPQIELPINFSLSKEQVTAFCQKWQVIELALFGSVLRNDFTPASDVDMLVTFDPQANPSLFDLINMQDELSQLLDREVDILTKKSVEQSHNWLRRRKILNTAQVIYAS